MRIPTLITSFLSLCVCTTHNNSPLSFQRF